MEELTKKQITELKHNLLERLEELNGMLSDSYEGSKPVGLDQPFGRLSRMDALQQQNMTQASRQAAQTRVIKISNALGRINQNDYGYCLECEEEIGYARLKAQPESPFCLDCQSRREKS